MKSIVSLSVFLCLLAGLLLVVAPVFASPPLVAKVNCDVARVTDGEYKEQWNRPWKFDTSELSFKEGLDLVSRRRQGTVKFRLVESSDSYEVTGEWVSSEQFQDGTPKAIQKFTPVRLQKNQTLPLSFQTQYQTMRFTRDCWVTLLADGMESSGTLALAYEDISKEYQPSKKYSPNALVTSSDAVNVMTRGKGQLSSEKPSNDEPPSVFDWSVYRSAVPFQQNQFCRLVGNFRKQLSTARIERNQIKESIAFREREQRLVALLPKGDFENWIVRAVSVLQAADGSAAVLFELPCDVVVGSYACGKAASQFLGTIREDSPIYNELAKVAVGDFLGVSGQFYFGLGSKAFEKNRSVASFRQMPVGSHCQGAEAGMKDGEFFAVSTTTLSALK